MAIEWYKSYPSYWSYDYVSEYLGETYNYYNWAGYSNASRVEFAQSYDKWEKGKLYEINDNVVYNGNIYTASKFIYLNGIENENPLEAKTSIDGRDFRVWIFVSSYDYAKKIYNQQNNSSVYISSDSVDLDTIETRYYPNGESVSEAPTLNVVETTYGNIESIKKNNHITRYKKIEVYASNLGLGTDNPYQIVIPDDDYTQDYPNGGYWDNIKLNSRKKNSYSPYLFSPEDDIVVDSDGNSIPNSKYNNRVIYDDGNDSYNKIEWYAIDNTRIGHSKESFYNFRKGMLQNPTQEMITPPDSQFQYILSTNLYGTSYYYNYGLNFGYSIDITSKYGLLNAGGGTTIQGEKGITKNGNTVWGETVTIGHEKTPIRNIWVFCRNPYLIGAVALIRIKYTRVTVTWHQDYFSSWYAETTYSDESEYWRYEIKKDDIIQAGVGFGGITDDHDVGDNTQPLIPTEWIDYQASPIFPIEKIRRRAPTDYNPQNVKRVIRIESAPKYLPPHTNYSYLKYDGIYFEKFIV